MHCNTTTRLLFLPSHTLPSHHAILSRPLLPGPALHSPSHRPSPAVHPPSPAHFKVPSPILSRFAPDRIPVEPALIPKLPVAHHSVFCAARPCAALCLAGHCQTRPRQLCRISCTYRLQPAFMSPCTLVTGSQASRSGKLPVVLAQVGLALGVDPLPASDMAPTIVHRLPSLAPACTSTSDLMFCTPCACPTSRARRNYDAARSRWLSCQPALRSFSTVQSPICFSSRRLRSAELAVQTPFPTSRWAQAFA